MCIDFSKEERLGLSPNLNSQIENIPDDCVLNPEDMADYLGLSVRQVRRYCEQGKIPCYCFGRKYIVYGNDFKEFLWKSKVRQKKVRESLNE